jgi:hypothetical protein
MISATLMANYGGVTVEQLKDYAENQQRLKQ